MRQYALNSCLSLLLLVGVATAQSSVVVTTIYGDVTGFQVPITNNDSAKTDVNVFLGIPFAQPPTGSLRFEKPVPPTPWSTARDTTSYGPACPQISSAFQFPITYSEDCLYLNVFAPNWEVTEQNKTGFAVMVYIHGGGFEIGSAVDYGYNYFVDQYVPRDVIIVTVQYRLAQFGFITFDNEEIPGNYGLWDLVAALDFVKSNAAAFGGDPDRITIFGHSAGGAAVGHLSLSPHADGLFNNAIQLSGSPYAEWASTERINASFELAAQLGCNGSGIKACLQSKTTADLQNAVDQIGFYRHDALNFFIFGPQPNDDFFDGSSTWNVTAKPTLISVSDGEGIEFTIGEAFRALNDLYVAPIDYPTFDNATFAATITRLIANEETVGSTTAAEDLLARIIDFYIGHANQHEPPTVYGNVSNSMDGPFYVRQYSKVVSDLMFLVPAIVDAKAKANAGWPTYLCRYGYVNIDSVFEEKRPVYVVNAHAGEYPYLFNVYYDKQAIPFSQDDEDFRDNYLDTLTVFAKTANPSTDVAWPQLSNNNLATLPHVELAPTLTSQNNLGIFTETLAFWQSVRADFDFPDVHWFPTN